MSQATTWSVPLVGPCPPDIFAQRIDESLDALLSSNSGTSRPAYAAAGTIWISTATAGKLKKYVFDGVNDRLLQTVDTATGAILTESSKSADIASAATTDLSTATGDYVHITGTTTITAFGTAPAGSERTVRFTGALTLTHNATSLRLFGGVNVVTYDGLVLKFRSLGSGNWIEVCHYANGWLPIEGMKVAAGGSTQVAWTNLSAYKRLRVSWDIVCTGMSGGIMLRSSSNNGSSYDSGASDYRYHGTAEVNGAITAITDTTTTNYALVSTPMSNNVASGTIEIFNFNTSANSTVMARTHHISTVPALRFESINGFLLATGSRNALQISASAGSFAGTFLLEGIRG